MDKSPDVSRSGRVLVIVMSASGEEVESVAVQVLTVFGHCTTAEEQQATSFLGTLVSDCTVT